MKPVQGARIHIDGVVQGVGFRPFVYGLAARFALTGWVRNTSAGVDIEVDGAPEAIREFVQTLQENHPPLATIDRIHVENRPADGFVKFVIVESEAIPDAFQPISPDVSICPDCLRELFDPSDRRYLYPFINCTNCGPRFTIIADIPYDRPNTSMAAFELCPDCAAEYQDPLDRRFHAQPVACPACGPRVWLESSGRESTQGQNSWSAILEARKLLSQGKIVAVKGLGGFHLACDATRTEAVAELRRRKLRVDKPFAVMMADLATVEAHCFLSGAERELLESRQRPVVILKRKPSSSIAPDTAPQQDTLGVMLPYTPLHYLLFRGDENDASSASAPLAALVMTSGNLSEEPIATENQESRERLGLLADAFLMHDRPILTRCDDSVLRVFSNPGLPSSMSPDQPEDTRRPETGRWQSILPIRRARGYAPAPIHLPWELPALLAAGAELKNTFCLTRGSYAFLSHHIGDLENYETLRSFEEGIEHYERLFRIQPQALAYDLHPDYLATRYALERAAREDLPAFGVQHHHAHIAACMAEHGLPDDTPVIGVAFDGTGYGEDGKIWGGEFLLSTYSQYRRVAHLAYNPLPGGDAAVRKPARAALAYLWQAGIPWTPEIPSTAALSSDETRLLRRQLENRINTPLTSSMGRLFDVAAALAGIRQQVNYEAQAAIEMEALVDPDETGAYSFDYSEDLSENQSKTEALALPCIIANPAPVIRSVLSDRRAGQPLSSIAARFHNSIASMVIEVCTRLRALYGSEQVCLSGGVWQNITLLSKTTRMLEENGFKVYYHHQAPANDGGLALGQAVIAAHRLWAVSSRISTEATSCV